MLPSNSVTTCLDQLYFFLASTTALWTWESSVSWTNDLYPHGRHTTVALQQHHHPFQKHRAPGNLKDSQQEYFNVDFISLFCGKPPAHSELEDNFYVLKVMEAVSSLDDKTDWAPVCKLEAQLSKKILSLLKVVESSACRVFLGKSVSANRGELAVNSL